MKYQHPSKALMLFLRLLADSVNYTPRSHKAMRAARLMPLIKSKYL